MKPNLSLLALLTVVALASVFLTRQCSREPDEHAIALDSLEVRIREADSAAAVYQTVASRFANEASVATLSAAEARADAKRLAAVAARLGAQVSRHRNTPMGDSLRNPTTDSLTPYSGDTIRVLQAFDSLLTSNQAWERTDSLNQVTIRALTRRIVADSNYILSLEAVKAAGQRAVDTRPGWKILGCAIGPAAVVGLDGRVSAGAGLACGFRF